MSADPKTRIPDPDRRGILERHWGFIENEARRLVSRGGYPPRGGFAIAKLEVTLTLGAADLVEHAVVDARAAGVSWDEVARVAGLSSRGSAARRFGGVRGSQIETPAQARIRKLNAAKRARNDNFRTRLEDVERELAHYPDAFRGKTVYLPADDADSAFWRYFEDRFDKLGLLRLIATRYAPTGGSSFTEVTAGGVSTTPLTGTGDFRSPECLALLEQSDIVVTNPPFSLFREFVALLVDHEKNFLVLGGMNAVTYREVWSLIRGGQVWLGATSNSGEMQFNVPVGYARSRKHRFDAEGNLLIGVGVRWFTTLEHDRRHDRLDLTSTYDPARYPRYDNANAIEVSRVADIPADYPGTMGVPLTFLAHHDPAQFEIVGYSGELPGGKVRVDGQAKYDRILIVPAVS